MLRHNRMMAQRRRHRGTPIHFVVDNLSAHKTEAVKTWLAAHSRVTMNHTPTHSSRLNQLESWFARIERDCIARGIFTSTTQRYLSAVCVAYRRTWWPNWEASARWSGRLAGARRSQGDTCACQTCVTAESYPSQVGRSPLQAARDRLSLR